MLRSRLVGLALRYGLRASSTTSRPTRSYPLRIFQSRSYSNGTHHKDQKLARQHYEDNNLSDSQSWRRYVIPTAILVIAGAGTLIHFNDERRATSKESQQSTTSEVRNINRPAIGGPFRLYDTKNNLVTESNLRGKWTLMYFGYTSCPDVGPGEIQKITEAINILECKYDLKITPVFITIDPQRDSPAQLKAYLEELDPRIIGLTGPIAAVRQIAQEYRVYFKKFDEIGQDYLVECSHNMYLLDPNLETVRCFGVEYDASQLADAIMMDVSRASK
ncbi:protein SCO1 homolog 2, mitochondrial isoform X1 [Typha latifolia]|uniref:protein SCO1 homolog 2, mitochondrial isoform X1 n=1 Tax=Typha latifolia TaxID=4733 RepID=UPI003C2FBB37